MKRGLFRWGVHDADTDTFRFAFHVSSYPEGRQMASELNESDTVTAAVSVGKRVAVYVYCSGQAGRDAYNKWAQEWYAKHGRREVPPDVVLGAVAGGAR